MRMERSCWWVGWKGREAQAPPAGAAAAVGNEHDQEKRRRPREMTRTKTRKRKQSAPGHCKQHFNESWGRAVLCGMCGRRCGTLATGEQQQKQPPEGRSWSFGGLSPLWTVGWWGGCLLLPPLSLPLPLLLPLRLVRFLFLKDRPRLIQACWALLPTPTPPPPPPPPPPLPLPLPIPLPFLDKARNQQQHRHRRRTQQQPPQQKQQQEGRQAKRRRQE